jgi:hypothetical protein
MGDGFEISKLKSAKNMYSTPRSRVLHPCHSEYHREVCFHLDKIRILLVSFWSLLLLMLLLLRSQATRETDYASSHCTN